MNIICRQTTSVNIDLSPHRISYRLLQPRNEPLSADFPEHPYALRRPNCDFQGSFSD